ncbi:hypothetical protein PSY19_24405, partial [Shigella flexneri]|nr:hypothetical protein [Shigella flexneri]
TLPEGKGLGWVRSVFRSLSVSLLDANTKATNKDTDKDLKTDLTHPKPFRKGRVWDGLDLFLDLYLYLY